VPGVRIYIDNTKIRYIAIELFHASKESTAQELISCSEEKPRDIRFDTVESILVGGALCTIMDDSLHTDGRQLPPVDSESRTS
jgi:hypothetical protein